MDTILYSKLLNSSLRYLSYRPRSIKETREFLRDKLKTWKVSDDGSLEKVITSLTEMRYLDDVKFAQWLVEGRRGRKPKGESFIRRELRNKGVEDDIIENALKYETTIGEDEIARAKKAIATIREVWGKLPKMELRRKLYAYLMRRGFSVEIAAKIVDETAKKD